MKLDKIDTIFATRSLVLGGSKRILVLLGKPEKFPDSDDYYCPYQIIGLGTEKVRYAGGIDAIQALQLALNMIGTDLYTSAESKNGDLSWEGGQKGELGFPVPDAIRDLLPR